MTPQDDMFILIAEHLKEQGEAARAGTLHSMLHAAAHETGSSQSLAFGVLAFMAAAFDAGRHYERRQTASDERRETEPRTLN